MMQFRLTLTPSQRDAFHACLTHLSENTRVIYRFRGRTLHLSEERDIRVLLPALAAVDSRASRTVAGRLCGFLREPAATHPAPSVPA
jgi:hypothetical protein